MVRKIRAKLVLQVRVEGLSSTAIASSQDMSRQSIAAVLEAADATITSWDDVAELTDVQVYARLFAGRGPRGARERVCPVGLSRSGKGQLWRCETRIASGQHRELPREFKRAAEWLCCRTKFDGPLTIQPRRDAVQLSLQLIPRLTQIECAGTDSSSLDGHVEVGLRWRISACIQQ